MPVIDGITIDVEWWTNQETESDPRDGVIEFVQPHHTASTSLNGSRSLMDPGGRTVSANGLLDIDGTLYGVVLPGRRAYTSASQFDHRCFTVEQVNATGAPDWQLTDAQHRRMGQLLREVAMLRNRAAVMAMIVPHNEVPGSYATACPGPSFSKQKMLEYALGSNSGATPQKRDTTMSLFMIHHIVRPDEALYLCSDTGGITWVGNLGSANEDRNEDVLRAVFPVYKVDTTDGKTVGLRPIAAAIAWNRANQPQVAVDSAALTKAVREAIKASPLDVDENEIARIVAPLLSSSLQKQFDEIPYEVNQDFYRRIEKV